MKGARILLNPLSFDFTKCNHLKDKIAGYDIFLSERFNEKYGVKAVLFKGMGEDDIKQL